jgi:lipoprotein NlpD
MPGAPDQVMVRPGDTLYSIAWRYDLDYRDLARWNGIGPNFRILAGQPLRLRPPAGSPVPRARAPGDAPRPATPAAGASTATGPSLAWVWPTEPASTRAVPGGGLLLMGSSGQEVRAAAAGRVVYTGSGLRSYGQLLIIRHSESLLSAYAHNRELLVREGQEVAPGQPIARMGEAGRQAVLYFEIRVNGKPVDPLPYLSGRK